MVWEGRVVVLVRVMRWQWVMIALVVRHLKEVLQLLQACHVTGGQLASVVEVRQCMVVGTDRS